MASMVLLLPCLYLQFAQIQALFESLVADDDVGAVAEIIIE